MKEQGRKEKPGKGKGKKREETGEVFERVPRERQGYKGVESLCIKDIHISLNSVFFTSSSAMSFLQLHSPLYKYIFVSHSLH